MNRRKFVAGAVTVPGVVAAQITHVDTKSSGPKLKSAVVKAKGVTPEGAAPGAKAYVEFNGPTGQLAALASGFCVLEPGAKPHPPHQHPEEEIMICGEGSGEFSIEGVVTQVTKGDMLYVEGNVLHGVLNTGKVPMTFYFMKLQGKA